jgi:hypothetical protein
MGVHRYIVLDDRIPQGGNVRRHYQASELVTSAAARFWTPWCPACHGRSRVAKLSG